jgi:LacI family transcriptional regulator
MSRSSVSLVLNGRADGNISAANQQRIMEAARQLGYRPNALALSLRSQRTWTLGVLTWQGGSGLPELLLHAAWETATAASFALIVMDIANDPEHEARAVATLLDRQVDACVVVAPELVEYSPCEALMGTRTYLLNCVDPQQRVTSIAPDEVGAGACAAQILLDRGHRAIAVLTDEAPTAQIRDRVAGVQTTMDRAGLPPATLLVSDRTVQAGAARAYGGLAGADPPTGMICLHERLALGAVLAAGQLGLAIPDDLSLVSMDDGEQLAEALVPALATVQRPDRAMAEQAVGGLMKEITSDADTDVKQLLFVCPPALRHSTGPPADPAASR